MNFIRAQIPISAIYNGQMSKHWLRTTTTTKWPIETRETLSRLKKRLTYIDELERFEKRKKPTYFCHCRFWSPDFCHLTFVTRHLSPDFCHPTLCHPTFVTQLPNFCHTNPIRSLLDLAKSKSDLKDLKRLKKT